jgi:hypothetical protein
LGRFNQEAPITKNDVAEGERMNALIRRFGKQRTLGAFLLVLILALAIGIPALAVGRGGPTGLPPLSVPPTPPPVVDPKALQAAREALESGSTDRVDLGNGSVLYTLTGRATRGKTFQIAGVSIKLPDDAELDGVMTAALPDLNAPPVRHPPLPLYRIVRGDARAAVSGATGEFWVTKGSPERFQFLVDALGADRLIPYPPTLQAR